MASETSSGRYPANGWQALIVRALTTVRLPEADATLRAARMTEADRQGVDLRGTVRLPQYGPGICVAGIRFALDTLRPDTV